jgi:type IV secretory pathway component VirB8
MDAQEQAEMKQAIEDGSYFREARSWYSRVNLALMSERVFYIVLTAIAALIFLIGVVALIRLMPIKPTRPFIYISKTGTTTLARLRALSEGSETPDEALRRYFCTEYLKRRENYSIKNLSSNVLYIYRHSDEKTGQVYQRFMDKSNNRSPIVMYQAAAERAINVTDINITPKGGEKYVADVEFDALVTSMSEQTKTQYHATIDFKYKDLGIPQEKEVEKGKATNIFEQMSTVKVTPMEFMVTSYSVMQRK